MNNSYLIVGISGTTLTTFESELLMNSAIAGIILFTRNYESPVQLKQLVDAIKILRKDLFVCVDHEGGRVQRFRDGFTELPAFGDIAARYADEQASALRLAKSSGFVMAYELAECHVDFSFTPVLDLDRGLNEVIGNRSFGADPKVVYELAHAYCAGVQQCGMSLIGKHFPGHGGVSEDTHDSAAVDTRSFEALTDDIYLYAQLFETNSLKGIMASHILYEKVSEQPAGFSNFWLNDVLRQQLGFEGSVFSDCLTMQAARAQQTVAEAAVIALRAGCNYILVCNELDCIPDVIATVEKAEYTVLDNNSYLWHRDQSSELAEAAYEEAKTYLEAL